METAAAADRQHVILVTPDEHGWTLTVPTRPTIRVVARSIREALEDLAVAWTDADAPAIVPVLVEAPPAIKPDTEAWRRLTKPRSTPP